MNHNRKKVVIEEKKRINYFGHYTLIVSDIAVGKRRRYTVYQVPSSPSRKIKVIGRELPLRDARRIVAK